MEMLCKFDPPKEAMYLVSESDINRILDEGRGEAIAKIAGLENALDDAWQTIAAVVLSLGGKVSIDMDALRDASTTSIESYRDERSRRLVLRVTDSDFEEREGAN